MFTLNGRNDIGSCVLELRRYDDVHTIVDGERSELMELSEHFTFFPDNYQFSPKFKSGMWDGRIRMYNWRSQKILSGLRKQIIEFANERGWEVKVVDPQLLVVDDFSINNFINKLNIPYKLYDFQLEAITNAICSNRSITVCPTGAGKSLIIYVLLRWFHENKEQLGQKVLITVPTVTLVNQMYSDFDEYSQDDPHWNVLNQVHKITAGKEKTSDKLNIISTWQSIYKQNERYFKQYRMILGDEVHTYDAKSLIGICEKLTQAKYRHGFTATLKKSKTHILQLQGLFGQVFDTVSTRELIDRKILADVTVKCIVLKYPRDICKTLHQEIYKKGKKPALNYQAEREFILSSDWRNHYICKLADSLEGNVLILFQLVEKHGVILYNMLNKTITHQRPISFISGKTGGDERELIRQQLENQNNAIIAASFRTFSVGTNVRNLHHLILASPSKESVKLKQAIGRVLRRGKNASNVNVIDIADDLTWNDKQNYFIKHFIDRYKIYIEEQFDPKIINIDGGF